MDLPADLVPHLRDLVGSIGAGDDIVADSLAALVEDLEVAVSSYQGLQLTLVIDGWPISLTAFADLDAPPPATSLHIALSSVGRGFDQESQAVLYARTPGAFIDLAADLDYLQRGREPTPAAYAGNGHRPAVELDADLPPASVVSGLSGLTEYATINRAVGVLIDRGHLPDHARAALSRAAATDGLGLSDYAARLLRERAN